MADRLELTLTLHGLDEYNQDVDGEVFAKKLTAFLKGIRFSDKQVNGRRRHKLLLTDLRKNTATASVREQVYQPGPTPGSGMAFYENAVAAIFANRPDARNLPLSLVREISNLNSGVGHTFAFGELKSNTGTVVRIDDYLGRVARSLVVELESGKSLRVARFAGAAFAYFDGELKEVDLRGTVKKAFLVLTAGGKQIECTVEALTVGQLRDALDHRVIAYGRAHYDGVSGLPARLEVITAKPVPDPATRNLARWRGSFNLIDVEASAEGWSQ